MKPEVLVSQNEIPWCNGVASLYVVRFKMWRSRSLQCGTEGAVKSRVTDHLLLLLLLRFALTLRGPSGGHCVELRFHALSTYFLFLDDPPEVLRCYCVGHKVRKILTRWGPLGPPACGEPHPSLPAPAQCKLHAVAPKGAPEGQCE